MGHEKYGFKIPEIFKCMGRGSLGIEGIFIFNFGQNISTVSCKKAWKGKACLGDFESLRALGARKVAGKLEKGGHEKLRALRARHVVQRTCCYESC